jgi:hypothetical protein
VRRKALIVLHHLDAGIVQDHTAVALSMQLSAPAACHWMTWRWVPILDEFRNYLSAVV